MCNLMLFIFYWIESNLCEERIDVCKRELSVTETYTSLNHSNKHYIFTVLTTLFCMYKVRSKIFRTGAAIYTAVVVA